MTQKDKQQLLLIELCARQPYGVILKTPQGDGYLNEVSLSIFSYELGVNIKATERTRFKLEECKPYLRPMSSMTEEEKKECNSFFGGIEPYDCDFSAYPIEYKYVYEWDIKNYIDFLNTNHFDYRGLIPMGLAIKVTKENNPYKEIKL